MIGCSCRRNHSSRTRRRLLSSGLCRADANPNRKSELEKKGAEIFNEPASSRNLLHVFAELGGRSVQSVLVEGGANVAGALLEAGSKQGYFLHRPSSYWRLGTPGAIGGMGAERMIDAIDLENVEITQRGVDYEITGYPRARRGEGVKRGRGNED